jgi:ketosteroid isomerase-like protein
MKKILLTICASLILSANVSAKELTLQQNQKIQSEITAAMTKYVKCWNNGDLECFMDGYVNSDKTLFISGDKFIYGWQNSYDHYKKKYGDDKKGMGHLQIMVEDINPIDSTHSYLTGKWHLTTESKEYNGVTSLIFEKVGKKWQIILDHSN